MSERPTIDQLMELMAAKDADQKAMEQLAAEKVTGQSIGGGWNTLTGRGASDEQRRQMMQTYSAILNRGPGQSAIGAAGAGFEKGRVLIDDIRTKDKAERLKAAQMGIDRQTGNISSQAKIYGLGQAEDARKTAAEIAEAALARKTFVEDRAYNTPKPKADYILGKTRYDGTTNQPIATSAPTEASLENLPVGFRWVKGKEGEESEPIPGAGKRKLSVTEAAKLQLVQGAIDSMPVLDGFLYERNEDGSIDYGTVDRTNILNMAVPFGGTPFSEGRSANALIKDAIEAKLRPESGAAVPETEVVRANERFRPSILDSDETIALKRKLLNNFLTSTIQFVDPMGQFTRDGMDYMANAERQLGQESTAYPGVLQTKVLNGISYFQTSDGQWHTQD